MPLRDMAVGQVCGNSMAEAGLLLHGIVAAAVAVKAGVFPRDSAAIPAPPAITASYHPSIGMGTAS